MHTEVLETLHINVDDVEAFIERMRALGWQGRICQTAPGAFEVDASMVRGGGFAGARTRHSVANARELQTPAGARTFGLVIPELSTNHWCHRSYDRVILQMMPQSDYAASNSGSHCGFQLAFDDALVAETLEQLEQSSELRPEPTLLELGLPAGQALAASMNQLFEPELDALTHRSLREDLLTMLLLRFSQVRPLRSGRAVQRLRAFRRAREHMHAHLHEPMTLTDLCRSVGASRRSLTQAFGENLGVSPMAYLKLLRLNRARCELRRCSGDVRVADVANAIGFWHLGQFATDYRRLFGELPSATLRDSSAPERVLRQAG